MECGGKWLQYWALYLVLSNSKWLQHWALYLILSTSKWRQYCALYLVLYERYNTIADDMGVDTAVPRVVQTDVVEHLH